MRSLYVAQVTPRFGAAPTMETDMKEMIDQAVSGLLSIVTGIGRIIGIAIVGILILALLQVPPFGALVPLLSSVFSQRTLL